MMILNQQFQTKLPDKMESVVWREEIDDSDFAVPDVVL
jgi:hypothetical protein